MKKFYYVASLQLLLLLLGAHSTMAQEPRVFSQFFMNPFIYNPSYAGVEGHSVVFLMHRQQWTGIQGAPSISHISFHTPLPNGIGLGGALFNESMGLISNVGFKGAASYLINMDRTHYLRFGMSLGLGTTSINFGQLDDPTDPAFTSLVSDKMYAIGEFGATYHTGHFNFGFALPSLFSYDIASEIDFSPVRVTPLDRALLKVNYRGHITDDFAFEPHIIYRYSKNTADQLEAAAIIHIKHLVWTGASYRQNAGFIGLIGTKIKEAFGVGYAYELGKPSIANLTGSTHEIHIGYHIGSKKHHAEHVSSFIKSHRLTAEERAAKAEEERLKQLAALAKNQEGDLFKKPVEQPEEVKKEYVIGGDDIVVTDRNTGEEKTVKKADIKNVWVYEKPSNTQAVTRVNNQGKIETAVVFSREAEDGTRETVIDFIPVPEPGSKTTWSIANPNAAPLERVNAKGEKELGIEWLKADEKGNMTTVMSWSKVYKGEVKSEQLINDIEGIQIPDSNEIPILRISENLRPDEKVEELKIEFDNSTHARQQPIEQRTVVQPIQKQEPIKDQVAQREQQDNKQPVKQETTQRQDVQPKQETTQRQELQPKQDTPAKQDAQPKQDARDRQTTQAKQDVAQPKPSTEGSTHMLELPKGFHIIAGAFENFENAEKYSDRLFQRGFIDVKVGYMSSKKIYYVVLSSHGDAARARADRDRIRASSADYAEVWMLVIQ